jgi:hypothetical protein
MDTDNPSIALSQEIYANACAIMDAKLVYMRGHTLRIAFKAEG